MTDLQILGIIEGTSLLHLYLGFLMGKRKTTIIEREKFIEKAQEPVKKHKGFRSEPKEEEPKRKTYNLT